MASAQPSCAIQKLENLAWQYRIQGWNVALGASGTIKAAHVQTILFNRPNNIERVPGRDAHL